MNREQVKEKIDAIMNDKIGIEHEDLTDDARFTEDLGLDSLDEVEVVMEIEKEFQIAIDDTRWEYISTLGEAVDMVVEILSSYAKA